MKWLNDIKNTFHTKISLMPIVYVTDGHIDIRHNEVIDGAYKIYSNGYLILEIVPYDNGRKWLRGRRASLVVYDDDVAKKNDDKYIEECIMPCVYDGVMHQTKYPSSMIEEIEKEG